MIHSRDPFDNWDAKRILQDAGFDRDKPVSFGMVFTLNTSEWTPPEPVARRFGAYFVSLTCEPGRLIRVNKPDLEIDGPAIMFAMQQKGQSLTELPRAARPLLETLAGSFNLISESSASGFLLGERVWEGFMQWTPQGTIKQVVGRRSVGVSGIGRSSLEEHLEQVEHRAQQSQRPELDLALRWYMKGCVEHDIVDKFLSYWLALLPCVRTWHAATIGGDPSEMERFLAYLEKRASLKDSSFEEAIKSCRRIYGARNELLKGSTTARIDVGLVDELKHLLEQTLLLELQSEP